MASQALTGAYLPQGVNGSNRFAVLVTLTSALAAAQTLDITLPTGVDPEFVPVAFRAYNAATPAVELSGPAEANLSITNHNQTTGVTRLTAAAAGIANAARVIVVYELISSP